MGNKGLCLIDAMDKYAWTCDVYVGTNSLLLGMPNPKKGDDAQVGPNVVHDCDVNFWIF